MKIRINIFAVFFCIYIAAVAMLCFMHGDNLPDMSTTWFGLPSDKVAHFLMFLPFTPLAYLTFRRKGASLCTKLIILTLMLTIGSALAYMTEIIQEKLSYRTYETTDLYMDCTGLIAGFTVVALKIIIKTSRKRH